MQERLELFRWIATATRDGLWMLDAHGRTLFANPRMAELLGRPLEEMAGFSAFDALDEQGREDLHRHLSDMVGGHPGEENVETMLVRADGERLWTLVSWSEVRDDEGRNVGWLHRVAPYSDRKKLIETLQVREQQLATAQSIAHIGSWEWDVPTDTVTWSDELYRIYNLQPREYDATYEGFLAFVHPEDRALVRTAVESTFAGHDEFDFEARIVRKGGDVRWIRGLGKVERGVDGAPVRMGGTAQDITDLKTADTQAAEATRRLQLLQQMAVAANQAASLTKAVTVAAARLPEHTTWSAICVFTPDQDGNLHCAPLPPGPLDWSTPPDPALAERARGARTMVHGPPTTHAETHSVVAVPVLLDGDVIAVIELLADEVPPDDHSRSLIDQIAAQMSVVAERERSAAQLAVARDEAMEASRLKSEFLATMSHEIRTPMNGVIGLNDLLMRTDLDEHQRRLAEGLHGAGLTLLGLINDILDLSKIEAGKLELEKADFDVRAVFEQTAAMLSGPAHEKGLELVVACHPDVPQLLRGDAIRFGQVLSNLGSNAVKFTDRGEVTIRATVASNTPHEVVLRVAVADSGVGIQPDQHERLFDAFTQADPSTTRRHGGTGLGLAISRQLVEALGGSLTLSSEVGFGSTFTFTARFEPAQRAPIDPTSGAQLLAGRRALVVDDSEPHRFILTEQLEAWRLEAVAVESAAEALGVLREAARAGRPFEIVLLDRLMPDTDGLELARRIHADPELAGLTLLLLSSGQQAGSADLEAAGIHAALSKPVRHSELFDALVDSVGVTTSATPIPRAHPDPPTPGLGVEVLVVEDNRVNQLVATGLLESLGCTVHVAGDGAEAVQVLSGPHRYAAVLMDCRMPRLDGFDATRAVRAQEPQGRRVPIIAMTASALEGERERCLAVGMDDFLTKPVDAAELERVIRQWTGSPAARPAAEAPAPPPALPPALAPVLDRERVELLSGLVKDGVSFFERTAGSFLGRVGDQVVAIRDAIDEGDSERLTGAAHQLKGSALNLGLPLVAAAARRLEVLGDTGDLGSAPEGLEQLLVEVDRAVAALQGALAPRS